MSPDETDAARRIKEKARELGFDAVSVASAEAAPELEGRLFAFLEQGRHGEMAWMETRAGERAAPRCLWPAAKSVVMLGVNYGPERDPLEALERKTAGAISVYAQNRDYHDVVKKRLKALGRFMAREFDAELKVFVDTAPVMEKPLAAAAGVGWQGKHTNLVSREFGSWLFLGAVFTTLELAADVPETDHCGKCRRCLDICPTDAFPNAYELDARRCISYLTIEMKGPIPVEFRRAIGNRIYGCDDCLAVCPWNKFASRAREAAFHARKELKSPPLDQLAVLDDTAFRTLFSASPIKRTGRNRFVRNVLIAIGNSGDTALVPAALGRLDDAAPIVRGAAAWALRQLLDDAQFDALARERAPVECDESVLAEWRGDAP
ncbi:MAG: tRNA epoxyqueuosine(34) reductase QueG [Parvularculaceae bacterium]